MPAMKTRQLAPIIGVVLIISGCQMNDRSSSSAPDFTLSSINGELYTRSKTNSKAMLVCFWAVGCGPCRMEAPPLNRLHEKYGPRGLKIFAINAWNEDREKVAAFVAEEKLKYPILMNGRQVFRERYGGRTIPRNFVIDSRGMIVLDLDRWDETEIVTKVEELLQS